MRIGILGAGGMADALGTQWIRAGHEVMVASRDPRRTAERAAAMGARPGTFAQAAVFGDVAVAAVLAQAAPDVLEAAGPALRGKPLIDVMNAPGVPDRYDAAQPLAQTVSRLTGAHVVKAFNLCHVDVWRMTPPAFDGRPVAVPLCGDDPAALEAARTLVSDLGCTPLHAGRLDRAALLEATAAFVIGLWFAGADAQAILPPLTAPAR